jgi:hypothetical protein
MRIRDPGWKKIQSQDPGSGMDITDLIFENLVVRFVGLKYLNSLMRIRDLVGIRDLRSG